MHHCLHHDGPSVRKTEYVSCIQGHILLGISTCSLPPDYVKRADIKPLSLVDLHDAACVRCCGLERQTWVWGARSERCWWCAVYWLAFHPGTWRQTQEWSNTQSCSIRNQVCNMPCFQAFRHHSLHRTCFIEVSRYIEKCICSLCHMHTMECYQL